MRVSHQASSAVETYSPAEERFNRRRRRVGFALGPVLFLACLALPLPGSSPEAHRLAAVLALVVTWWVTEPVPMAVTALVGPVLATLLGVAPVQEVFTPFGDPIIFLFIGSFMIAEAMFVHGVDRRIAYGALSLRAIQGSGGRVICVYGVLAAALSMWMSNTATTAMLFPIGLSIVSHLTRGSQSADLRRFAVVMMLTTSFAASIGGMATPVGTPPNLIGIGLIERILGVHLGFAEWGLVAMPAVIVLLGLLFVYFHLAGGRAVRVGETSRALVAEELARLGPLGAGERNVLVAFAVTVLLWVTPALFAIAGQSQSAFARAYAENMPEAIAALIGAFLLFVLPVGSGSRRATLTWEEAVRIDWGTILLFGGGLALGQLAFTTGLAQTAGEAVAAWLPSHSTLTVTALFTALAIVVSETTSNTASANMVVPVAIAVAQSVGVDPMVPALAATLGASMGFMMPISTPPNAIVYSSGHVPITAMMKYGALLDVAGFVVIVTVTVLLGPLLG